MHPSLSLFLVYSLTALPLGVVAILVPSERTHRPRVEALSLAAAWPLWVFGVGLLGVVFFVALLWEVLAGLVKKIG